MGVNKPVYVAGLERGVRPIGDWSTLITLSKNSRPWISPCGAGSADEPYRWRATAVYRVSLISVDLPDPDTPVTQTNSPTGRVSVTFFRLLPLAFVTTSCRSESAGRRCFGM